MKNLQLGIFFLAVIVLSSVGCASKKQGQWLARHAKLLEQAANTNMPETQKLDILAQSYADMMHQSLNFVDPKKGLVYAQAYSKQNKANINKIIKDLGDWKIDMNTLETIAFGIEMLQKPYTKDFISLLPRFRKKYQLYKGVYDLSGTVQSGLMDTFLKN